MKKNVVIVLMSVSFFLSFVATSYAACSGHSCTDVEVDRLYIRPEGDVWVDTSGTETDIGKDYCRPTEDKYIILKSDHKNKKEIYATLLSAQLLRKNVSRIRVTKDITPCQVDYVVLDKQ